MLQSSALRLLAREALERPAEALIDHDIEEMGSGWVEHWMASCDDEDVLFYKFPQSSSTVFAAARIFPRHRGYQRSEQVACSQCD